jgi:hypothetical protein
MKLDHMANCLSPRGLVDFNKTQDTQIKTMSKRPQFGNRFLNPDDGDETVFKHNAW